ncbi:aspartate-semialdehyde dehydrogenase [Immundisolibacter sp.]|uniref:aspartate-semialdehyde dehydrogenase n=1 Tax=Immundisolibacter sp. TaxID=1934948 RepID=UPI0035657721
MTRATIAILGATSVSGQRLVHLLAGHPWFTVAAVTGPDHLVGKAYGDACRWALAEPMPAYARTLRLREHLGGEDASIVFSALSDSAAASLEPELAAAGHTVVSLSSAHRAEADVPLVLADVNPDHLDLLGEQRKRRGWTGALVTIPNCAVVGPTVVLKPLQDAFGLRRVFLATLQAVTGAGYPGVPALDLLDNVIPYIAGEEEKLESEPRKILGRLSGARVEPAEVRITAHAARVAVTEGHVACLSIECERAAEVGEASRFLASYRPPEEVRGLPSCPGVVLAVRPEADRPQPRRDRGAGSGMTTVVGRVRADPLLDIRCVVLAHNTIRGGAGSALLAAELLWHRRSGESA